MKRTIFVSQKGKSFPPAVDKLTEIFEKKHDELRKKRWNNPPPKYGEEWENEYEYDFQIQFEAEWAEYLNGLNCNVVDNDPEELVQMWNYGNKETIMIVNPEDERSWIFVPKDLSDKALVFGELPSR
jgi:hypothetical protein